MKRRPTFARLLLDTHVWFWYVTGSDQLPAAVRDALDEALGSCWLSPISLWELGMLAEKRRVRLHLDYSDWVRKALDAFPVKEAAINFDVAQRVHTLDLPHGDPADRFIAATALTYDLTVVTLDGHLTAAEWLPTLAG